ncbi:MAG: tRNA lysidine(34) synthetase TilS [Acidothermus sp.]|nr:tRNA lysidine(34) synthetase TilS [Acidothermus sp.]
MPRRDDLRDPSARPARPRLSPAVAAVRHAVRRSLTDLPADSLVLVACSGGPDSLALAAALAFEAPRRRPPLRAGAVSVDHRLQAGSSERAARLAEVLTDLGLDPVEVIPVEVGRDGGIEAAARAARYAALDDAAARHHAAAVLLGHSRDDQAETVLLGLLRGSGPRSFAGMPRRFGPGGRYRRPLLDLPRAVMRRACRDAGLPFWDDPQNADPAFTRARLRHRVMPLLRAELGPGIVSGLARTADLARADCEALDGWAQQVFTAIVTDLDGGKAAEVDALRALPTAVRRRVLRLLARAAGVPPGRLASAHIEAVDALLSAWHGQGPVALPGGMAAVRRCGRLVVHRALRADDGSG